RNSPAPCPLPKGEGEIQTPSLSSPGVPGEGRRERCPPHRSSSEFEYFSERAMTQAMQSPPQAVADHRVRMAAVAWVLTAIYYFYQYALRSAPAVMLPDLSSAFGISPVAVAAI